MDIIRITRGGGIPGECLECGHWSNNIDYCSHCKGYFCPSCLPLNRHETYVDAHKLIEDYEDAYDHGYQDGYESGYIADKEGN